MKLINMNPKKTPSESTNGKFKLDTEDSWPWLFVFMVFFFSVLFSTNMVSKAK